MMSQFPTIVPASVLGKDAPSNRIHVGIIGCGRYASSHDIPLIAQSEKARIVAVADIDKSRAEAAPLVVMNSYRIAAEQRQERFSAWEVKSYDDYRELLLNNDIDAVVISLPDHQHAVTAVHSVRAGKHVYLQKPATRTIEEGKILVDVIRQSSSIVQIGSQQRSIHPWPQFKRAAELVRNGRIGELKEIKIGFPADTGGGLLETMPIPNGLNYDAWLGPVQPLDYTEDRVHPRIGNEQGVYSRPGWLRCESFAAGMITNWGSHHIDIAHWAMGIENSGPIEIAGKAYFPKQDKNYDGLWDVHGTFSSVARYANGVKMTVSSELKKGIEFIGSEGWIFVSRGNSTFKDGIPQPDQQGLIALNASDHRLLHTVIAPHETHLYESEEQHLNWLNCIRSGNQPVAPIEVAHRSNSACLLHWIAMKLGRTISWDPIQEIFTPEDPEASLLLSYNRRKEYDF
jgi:predicted dehydrogenase